MRFGEYLILKGMIEESELEEALKVQQEDHVIMGVLATRENYHEQHAVRHDFGSS